jgi:excisionase family DNA binding protein
MRADATRLYRVKAIADLCEVSPNTVYRAIESGDLAAVKFGKGRGALRVSGQAVNAWLERLTVPAPTANTLTHSEEGA